MEDILEKHPNLVREVQKVQLEILKEFDRICRENNLQYHIFAGTLLGAVRHKGFIPWDDDIDVAMPRYDYERFLEIAQLDLGNQYLIQNMHTDSKVPFLFTKIRKKDTVFVERNITDKDIHHGIFIDVFPLDNVPSPKYNNFRVKILSFLIYINTVLYVHEDAISLKNRKLKRFLDKIISERFKIRLRQKIDKILRGMSKKPSGYVNHLTNGINELRYHRYIMAIDDLYDNVEIEFEGIKVYAPRSTNEYLSQLYGDFWKLPPEEERFPHHGIIKLKIGDKEW